MILSTREFVQQENRTNIMIKNSESVSYDIIEEERNEELSNDDLFNISSWGADPSVRELITQYSEGDIEKPELQRKYVWNKKVASRFIESLLLGLPVPSIFFANIESTGKRLIIDGYQRIRTLHDYIHDGIWRGDDSVFRLVDSNVINKRWRNKTFEELSESDKRRLKNYTIHAIIFEQRRPANDSAMFQIFERINTSGVSLNDQEVRNCVYQGAMNTHLFDLNKKKEWRVLFGKETQDNRMIDLELILRFFAMNKPTIYLSNEKNFVLKKILNDEMANNRSESDYLDRICDDFVNTIEFIYKYFGEEAFYNLQNDLQKIRKRLYPTVYDSLMIATSIALSKGFNPVGIDLKARRMAMLKDESYRESITQGTMTVEHIQTRIRRALEIVYELDL